MATRSTETPHIGEDLRTALSLAGGIAVLAAIWQAIVVWRDYPPFVLPSPLLVLQRLASELVGGTLGWHTQVTLLEALGGFAIALGVSALLGYPLAHAPRVERTIAPLLAATQAVPVVAIAPLIILWLGAGLQAKVLVAAIVTFFPVLSAIIVALRGVPPELIEAARVGGADRLEVFRFVELPLALPGVFGGIKSGLALATTGAVVGEFVGGRDGLGALINIARGQFDTPLIFAALTVLALITLLFYVAATLAERALVGEGWN